MEDSAMNKAVGIPPELAAQMVAQQVTQEMLASLGWELPKLWASTISVTQDPANSTVSLLFREGVRIEVRNPADEAALPHSQEVYRNIASLILPKSVVLEFCEQAVKHLQNEPATNV